MSHDQPLAHLVIEYEGVRAIGQASSEQSP